MAAAAPVVEGVAVKALQSVLHRVRQAAERSRHSGNDVRVVAVGKTKPISLIRQLYDAGHRCFGENYVQEFIDKAPQLDAEVHHKYIYGGHVAAYMRVRIIHSDRFYSYLHYHNIEELYKKVHAAIRADPTLKKSDKQQPKEHKRYNLKKLTYDERKNKLIERLNALNNAAGADDDEEEDD
ncbi:hypothetical protein AgCh_019009 [Apium graveolens]